MEELTRSGLSLNVKAPPFPLAAVKAWALSPVPCGSEILWS